MKKLKTLLVLFIGIVKLSYSQTVTIGSQVWSVKNLNVSTFRNGDPIFEAKTDDEWEKAGKNKQPAWCYYDSNPTNASKYGKLYNWYAVSDPRGLAPRGWHISSHSEFAALTNHLGGENEAGIKMKSLSWWKGDGNGSNISGFSGFPGGTRSSNGSFYGIGKYGYWWSSTDYNIYLAWTHYLTYSVGYINRSRYEKEAGLSVRCIKD